MLDRPHQSLAFSRASALVLAAAVAACSIDSLVGDGALPPDVPDPAITKTPAGAFAAYRGTLVLFRTAFGGTGEGSYIGQSGMLADELQPSVFPTGSYGPFDPLDSRTLPEYQDPIGEFGLAESGPYVLLYDRLHQVRGQAEEARGLLRAYGGDSAHVPIGLVDALEAYSDVFLAEFFCSGVPLSTVDFNGDYTYQPGSTTTQVFEHALTLFDSALTFAAESLPIVHLARVGKARALLGIGRFAEASQEVAPVPDGFQYTVRYATAGASGGGGSPTDATNFAKTQTTEPPWFATDADREGSNGLDYVSSGDPRTLAVSVGTTPVLLHPAKYAINGSTAIVLGDWIEARLIEAEAALQAGDFATWLAKLNHLRETAISPALTDTTDPGTPDARVDLTFRERAFWLFLTGHRQGDLRRLVRQYGRAQTQVYPSGLYPGGATLYGPDVTAPVPALEREFNKKFTGCIHRGA